jgi:hypothetical protein
MHFEDALLIAVEKINNNEELVVELTKCIADYTPRLPKKDNRPKTDMPRK